jgi:23S rRNA pseudouridine1911/1915/1917 synthase
VPAAPTLAALVRQKLGVSWAKAKALCEQGRVLVDGERCLDPAARALADAEIVVEETAQPKADNGPLPRSALIAVERDFVVVDKPAGMLAVADVPGNNDTLLEHTRALIRKRGDASRDTGLSVIHRIDRDTSGLMVFARTPQAQRSLAAQFRSHVIDRLYLALAHGDVKDARIESHLLPDRGDGLRGSHGHFRRASGAPPPESRPSVTNVRVLEKLRGATLVECRLETGRQHQIRIHLSEQGHPLLGERVYIRDFKDPRIDAPRTMLHARVLGFTHPRTGGRVRFESEAPADFKALLETLRRGSSR